jgi:hypothetical protein
VLAPTLAHRPIAYGNHPLVRLLYKRVMCDDPHVKTESLQIGKHWEHMELRGPTADLRRHACYPVRKTPGDVTLRMETVYGDLTQLKPAYAQLCGCTGTGPLIPLASALGLLLGYCALDYNYCHFRNRRRL